MGSTVTGLMDACACVLVCSHKMRWRLPSFLSPSLSSYAHTWTGTRTSLRTRARTSRVVFDLSSSAHPFPPSALPLSFLPFSLSLCGEQKEETLLLDVFSLQQVQFTQKRTRCLVFSVISTLTFIFPSATTSTSFFLFFFFFTRRRHLEKPADETWLIIDLDLIRVIWKWVPLLGLRCAAPPFPGPRDAKDAAGSALTCPGLTPARFAPVGSSSPALRCPQKIQIAKGSATGSLTDG